MGQAKNRLKSAMQATGTDAKAAQALLVEQAKEREKALIKPVAADDVMQHLTGEETWEQIQLMDGFRHFVLCDLEQELYLGMVRETLDNRQLAWTDLPVQAQAFSTLATAEAMIQHINGDPDYRQVPFAIGALMETETQYAVILKPETSDAVQEAS
jgi:hypothetical protein